jgi:hypothetical protein
VGLIDIRATMTDADGAVLYEPGRWLHSEEQPRKNAGERAASDRLGRHIPQGLVCLHAGQRQTSAHPASKSA